MARKSDIPAVEPLIMLPTLDTVVGYIPAKKKPSPAIATVITGRLCVAVSKKKNIVVATQYARISLFLSTFDDNFAVSSLPSITITHVTDTRLVAYALLIMFILLKYVTNQPFTQFSSPRYKKSSNPQT